MAKGRYNESKGSGQRSLGQGHRLSGDWLYDSNAGLRRGLGSDAHVAEYWWYSSFELAATKLYWALILPLAALFDWGRKMFESGRAIREAKKAQIRDEGVQEGREQAVQIVKAVLEEYDISLPPEAVEKMFGDARNGKR